MRLLETTLAGVDTLLLISSSQICQRATHVIVAAKKAGIKRIVYTSLLHADTSQLSLAEEHRQTEAAIQVSGLAYTLLRNGWYTENYQASIPGALAGGALIGSPGEGRVASATREDYAKAAVAALTGRRHRLDPA
ncbi:NAD(P)H-binding protein [Pluralibacter gergoviae]|uniref:NAD(P)H-binding protein n=1 Tax=Enterobacteriaceae TaxID=543 RepID=UPI003B5CE9BD